KAWVPGPMLDWRFLGVSWFRWTDIMVEAGENAFFLGCCLSPAVFLRLGVCPNDCGGYGSRQVRQRCRERLHLLGTPGRDGRPYHHHGQGWKVSNLCRRGWSLPSPRPSSRLLRCNLRLCAAPPPARFAEH